MGPALFGLLSKNEMSGLKKLGVGVGERARRSGGGIIFGAASCGNPIVLEHFAFDGGPREGSSAKGRVALAGGKGAAAVATSLNSALGRSKLLHGSHRGFFGHVERHVNLRHF
jgi:hypothetical protein